MPVPTLNAISGDPAANSYVTTVDAQTYFDSRGNALGVPEWDNLASQDLQLIAATRVLNSLTRPLKILIPAQGGVMAYYRERRRWRGTVASATQALPWPRNGMYDGNNNPIPNTVVPVELQEATAELAYQLAVQDRTLDNDVAVQGITAVRAGSVSVNFRTAPPILPQVLPDAVLNLLVYSWLTDERIIPAMPAFIDIFGKSRQEDDDRHYNDPSLGIY